MAEEKKLKKFESLLQEGYRPYSIGRPTGISWDWETRPLAVELVDTTPKGRYYFTLGFFIGAMSAIFLLSLL